MIRICSDCRKDMGEKPPYEDTSITHGLCPACVEIIREKVRKKEESMEKLRKSAQAMFPGRQFQGLSFEFNEYQRNANQEVKR